MSKFKPLLEPQDQLGKKLLQSLPKKIVEMFTAQEANHQADEQSPLQVRDLIWHNTKNSGSFHYKDITVKWYFADDGEFTAVSDCTEFQNITDNLAKFVDFELDVYAQVESYLSSIET
jgi:hypothetical protein